ncbi:unnamed protein product [Ilex paraguariensis]|uniref:Uncharacterized protein n=1 Tax=Ilex paraguariensis TaxID=185542 RepID=A0ABC8QVS3_9AQUA
MLKGVISLFHLPGKVRKASFFAFRPLLSRTSKLVLGLMLFASEDRKCCVNETRYLFWKVEVVNGLEIEVGYLWQNIISDWSDIIRMLSSSCAELKLVLWGKI